jgi:hypothetical protein
VTDGILYANRQRNSPVKNRMRETCTSGSVRGGDGNIPTYSALDAPQWGDEALERGLVGKPGKRVEERQLAGVVGIGDHGQHLAAEQARQQVDVHEEVGARACQSNMSSCATWTMRPLASGHLGRKSAPLLQRGRASLLVEFATDEMAFLIEVVVELGMN